MSYDLTHASWFSGVEGIGLGLERAGWRTVLHSEIDPYASAVLARHWPGVPNLGDILALDPDAPLPAATLWSGGFPCQDLSTAGARRGMARGTRSGLAHTFLDLVGRHLPPAVLIENVPGLLSSHRGRDLGTLLGRLGELGYGWAYRVLDAQHFDLPQRRRRVFVVALKLGGLGDAERAAEVLSVGTRCDRHPPTGDAAGSGLTPNIVGSLDTALGHHGGGWPTQSVASGHIIADGQHGTPPHPPRVREANGVAGRLDDRPVAFRKSAHVNADPGSPESWVDDGLANTLNTFDSTDIRTTHAVVGGGVMDDPMLPDGLDSHRYRCAGNGVAAPVSKWIGERLRAAVESAGC